MPDETIEFPSADGDGPYYLGAGGNAPPDGSFVLLETDDGTQLFEWDASAVEFVARGDVRATGAIDAPSVSADILNTADLANAAAGTVLVAQGDGTLALGEKYSPSFSGQTTDLSGSRAFSVSYQNTTGGPILLYIYTECNTNDPTYVQLRVDNTLVGEESYRSDNFVTTGISYVVGDGQTYELVKADGDITIENWFEVEI